MQIDLNKIKSIPIENFMIEMGFEIKDNTHTGIFFNSPFRSEKTASFSVQRKTNRWKDFGENGRSGDIIDLAVKLWGTDFKETINRLNCSDYATIKVSLPTIDSEPTFKLKKLNEVVQNKALISYLKSRRVTPIKVAGLVGEIYYEVNGMNYFSLAFKNDSGGYEMRNKYCKNCFGQKDVTTIERGYHELTVFEGFMDFLSLECWKPVKTNVMVLNSCCQAIKAIPVMNKYQKVYLALDNDPTGESTTQIIKENLKVKGVDLRYLYKSYKDINEWLTQKK